MINEDTRALPSDLILPRAPEALTWLRDLAASYGRGNVGVIQRPLEIEESPAEDAVVLLHDDRGHSLAVCVRVIEEFPDDVEVGDDGKTLRKATLVTKCPHDEMLHARTEVGAWIARELGRPGPDLRVGMCILMPGISEESCRDSALTGLPCVEAGAVLFEEDLEESELEVNGLASILGSVAEAFVVGDQPLPDDVFVRFNNGLEQSDPEEAPDDRAPDRDLVFQSANPLELARLAGTMVTALQEEINVPARRTSQEIELERGRRLSKPDQNIILYGFRAKDRVTLVADTPIRLGRDREWFDANLVSIEGSFVILALEEDIGDPVPRAKMQPDITFILKGTQDWLKALMSRLAPWEYPQNDDQQEVAASTEEGSDFEPAPLDEAHTTGEGASGSAGPKRVKEWPDPGPNVTLMAALLGDESAAVPAADHSDRTSVVASFFDNDDSPFTLNRYQREALVNAEAQSFHMIWGPPGTGKTATLGRVVDLLSRGKDLRVMVLAHANVAVDEAMIRVARAMAQTTLLEEGRILRVGNPRRQEVIDHPFLTVDAHVALRHPDLLDRKRELTAERRELTQRSRRTHDHSERKKLGERLKKVREELLEIRQRIKDFESQLIDEAQILGTTLSSFVIRGQLFSWTGDAVIVDETSMAPFPMVLLAAARSRSKLMLFGDFRQLGPICQSNKRAALNWLGRDAFSISGATRNLEMNGDDPRVTMLRTQYRMAAPIAEVISRFSYLGKLETDPSADRAALTGSRCEPLPGEPLVMADSRELASLCLRTRTKSRLNPIHAFTVIELARRALLDGAIDVAVITPYRAQANLLAALIEKAELGERVTAATIHTFQGAERDVVIFDLVDALPQKGPSKLTGGGEDAKRVLTVAASRPKGKLVVLVDSDFIRNFHPPDSLTKKLLGLMEKQAEILDLAPSEIGGWPGLPGILRFHNGNSLASVLQDLVGTGVHTLGINSPENALGAIELESLREVARSATRTIVFIEGCDNDASEAWEEEHRIRPEGVTINYRTRGSQLLIGSPRRGLLIGVGQADKRVFAEITDPGVGDMLLESFFGAELRKPPVPDTAMRELLSIFGTCPECGSHRTLKRKRFSQVWFLACSENNTHPWEQVDRSILQTIVDLLGITCSDCSHTVTVTDNQDQGFSLSCPRFGEECDGHAMVELSDYFEGEV